MSRGIGLANAIRIAAVADHLSNRVHFTTDECKAILVMFSHMAPSGTLDRLGLREFMCGCLDITDDVILDFIYRAFDSAEPGGNGTQEHTLLLTTSMFNFKIDESKFTVALSRMIRGSLEEQIDFCYNCYDVNGDGSLSRIELQHCLHGCIIQGYGIELEDIEDAEKEIVDICMRKLDFNGDGIITREDFAFAVMSDPLLIQAIGPCLPDPAAIGAFLATITDDYHAHSPIWTLGFIPSKKSVRNISGTSDHHNHNHQHHQRSHFVSRKSEYFK